MNALSPDDPFDLQRFVDAQNPVYEQVCSELRCGQKSGHWMWFIFPQIEGLGRSPLAEKYALSSRAEAQAYLHHPVLGPRLYDCSRLVTLIEGKSQGLAFDHARSGDEGRWRLHA